MIIHLGGGIRAVEPDLSFFREIIDVIHELGHEIALNWIELSSYNVNVKKERDTEVDWSVIVELHAEALRRSDAYIAEVSSYRLFHGYEMANALRQRKPVLLVSRPTFKQFAISGLDDDFLTMKNYETKQELAVIVKEFMKAIAIPKASRSVDVTLDNDLLHYLEAQEQKTHKSKSELLQEVAKQGIATRNILV